MNFIDPSPDELSRLRADPLLWEQELDVRPEFAEAVERACGRRAGRVYFRSAHDHLYAIELADLGRGRPSMAMVLGFWDRWEPRPPEHEIDLDLLVLCDWLARVGGLNPADVAKVAERAGIAPGWAEGSVLRTPENRFASLPGFAYAPRYVEVEGLRMAYVEEGSGDPILMLHGEPTWGYLYRRMIPALAKMGRVIVPDLVGFGRSDKPVARNAYSYKSHVRWMRTFIERLDLRRITLVVQDWGGLIGLPVLAEAPDRFVRLVAMNTGLPVGDPPGEGFLRWRRFSLSVEALDVAALMRRAVKRLSDAEAAAYQAPFPTKEHQTGALVFPRLVPVREEGAGVYENRAAVERLKTLDLPVLLPWATGDPITAAGESQLRSIFKNVAPALPIEGAGHFIQDDAGEEVAGHIAKWMEETRV